MTWTAKIESKTYGKGVLLIGVEYANGADIFSESIDLTGGTKETLDQKIQSRLQTLNQTEDSIPDIESAVAAKETIAMTPPIIKGELITP